MFPCNGCGVLGGVRCGACRKAWFCAACAGGAAAAHDCAALAAWPFEVVEQPGRGRCWRATVDVAAGACLWVEAPSAMAWLQRPDGAERARLAPWAEGMGGDWTGQPKSRHSGVALARALLASADWRRAHAHTDWAGDCGFAKRAPVHDPTEAAAAAAIAAVTGLTPAAVAGLVDVVLANAFTLRLWGHLYYDAAIAVYRLASYINTNCANKAVYAFAGTRIVILAEALIAAGEEITVPYAQVGYLCTCPVDHDAFDAQIMRYHQHVHDLFSDDANRLIDDLAALPACSPYGEAPHPSHGTLNNARTVLRCAPEIITAAIDATRREGHERFYIRLLRLLDAHARALRLFCAEGIVEEHPTHLFGVGIDRASLLLHVDLLIDVAVAMLDVCAQPGRAGALHTSMRTLAATPLVGALAACFIGVRRPLAAPFGERVERAADALWRMASGLPAGLDVFYSLRALGGCGEALYAYVNGRRPSGPPVPWPFWIASTDDASSAAAS